MQYRVAIVGATGAVGIEVMRVLEKRKFPVSELVLLASKNSAGKKLPFNGQDIVVQELTEDSFDSVDLAIFSAGGDVSRKYAPIAVSAGCVVIDNSSAFRMNDHVPLVVPEINVGALQRHQGIIANPNCTTAITLLALYPLHQVYGITRVIASTYQAVSGTGARAIAELEQQIGQISAGEAVTNEVYPYQIAYNVIPQVDTFEFSGYTREEMKMTYEGRKIMNHSNFQASVTCVRVPVFRAHSVSVTVEFAKYMTLEGAKSILRSAPGITVVDNPELSQYPMPLHVAGKDNCQVGRIRRDVAFENGLSFWIVGDQLLKGAALNAVQIAEELIHNDWLYP